MQMLFIIILLFILMILLVISIYFIKLFIKLINKTEKEKIKYKLYYSLINQWLRNKNFNNKCSDYLLNNNINKIAIYGMGELCERFYEEIRNSTVEVKYFIDINAKEDDYGLDGLPLVNLQGIELSEEVDVIVVTPIYAYQAIKKSLLDLGIFKNKIIGINKIIERVENN